MIPPKNIWLVGPSGAGKSTVGPLLAARLGLPFCDIDDYVERMTDRSITEIFADGGESEFRVLEGHAVEVYSSGSGPGQVVALGAGALVDPLARQFTAASGVRIFLDVEPQAAHSRLGDVSTRPMLAGEDPREAWERLYRSRLKWYRQADATFDTTGREPEALVEEIAAEIDRLLEPEWRRSWQLDDECCTVALYRSPFTMMQQLATLVSLDTVCSITDENVVHHYSRLVEGRTRFRARCMISPGEASKSVSSVEAIADEMVARGIPREGSVVGIGGGVVTDLAGFVASIYMRGVDSILVPTTLLAQVDAAIGGKTAVNAVGIRNLFGTVRQPRHVLIATGFLHTLPARELRSGIVEALKIGIMHRPELAELVREAMPEILEGRVPAAIVRIITLAVETKLSIVEQDLHDASIRLSLNFGHTFGHALEAVEPDVYTHGEAVAVGMIAACLLARNLEIITSGRQNELVGMILPLAPSVDHEHDLPALLEAMRGDKKRTSESLRFVLPGRENGYLLQRVGDLDTVTTALTEAFDIITTYRESHS